MDAPTLSAAMGGSLGGPDAYAPFVAGMNTAMVAANITNPLRAAHWCAQIGHESGGLRWMEEIADGSAYEGRVDLGNTQPGDGRRFKGSGPIQLTGRANFTRFSQWAYEHNHIEIPNLLVDQPQLVRQDPRLGFLAASWYWTVARPNLNALCDADDLNAVTRSINGGLNGIDDRRQRLARCKQLGAALMPTPTASTKLLQPDEILAQIGSGHPDWKPLGHDEHGDPLTLRDAVGAIGREKAEQGRLLRALAHQEGTTP